MVLHQSPMKLHMLSFGAEPDIKDKQCGGTPLVLAARWGHDSVVKI